MLNAHVYREFNEKINDFIDYFLVNIVNLIFYVIKPTLIINTFKKMRLL